MNYCNLNGKIVGTQDAALPADNGAFRYGYGLFETMLVEDGTIALERFHRERLFEGLRQLHFEIPAAMGPEWLTDEVLRTVRKNGMEKLCRVRLQIFAGGGGLYGGDVAHPGFLIECFSLDAQVIRLNENGLVAGFATGLNKSMDSLCNIKSCNALIYAIAARQALENKWNDALVCNTDGNVIESTIANIFWIKDEQVYTPPLKDGCVAGVMRRFVTAQIAVTEKSLDRETLLQADEVFLTNAVRRIKWIGSLREKKFGSGYIHQLISTIKT